MQEVLSNINSRAPPTPILRGTFGGVGGVEMASEYLEQISRDIEQEN